MDAGLSIRRPHSRHAAAGARVPFVSGYGLKLLLSDVICLA